MGFGHRVYKVEDPRATVLRPLAQELGERTGRTAPYEISREIEKAVLKDLSYVYAARRAAALALEEALAEKEAQRK